MWRGNREGGSRIVGQEILGGPKTVLLQSRGAIRRRPRVARRPIEPAAVGLAKADYVVLAEFRFLLRSFLEFSEHEARGSGLTPRQHQALLQIKGWPGRETMSVGELAARLLIRHHSAVELVDRLEEAGLVERLADRADRRRVLLRLTEKADAELARLAATHLQELQRLRPALLGLLKQFPAPTGNAPAHNATGLGERAMLTPESIAAS